MDLRKCINFISDIVNNRPMPIRELDQIYMKHADMLLQIEHISKWFSGKRVIFIGDGDAIALGLAYLQKNEELESSIKEILVLDFDQRIVNSINKFAAKHDLVDIITARLYNVADALPIEYWHKFDCFYCNPPYGASNEGVSITSFMKRGFEATGESSLGCVVIADVPDLKWTVDVIFHTQMYALSKGYIVCEMIPEFHSYHLDDDPDLKSCSIVFRRRCFENCKYASEALSEQELDKFYGEKEPLIYQYVRDLTERKDTLADYELVPFTRSSK